MLASATALSNKTLLRMIPQLPPVLSSERMEWIPSANGMNHLHDSGDRGMLLQGQFWDVSGSGLQPGVYLPIARGLT
jgi:hypothetical protein